MLFLCKFFKWLGETEAKTQDTEKLKQGLSGFRVVK
jgi:hypothetical protein